MPIRVQCPSCRKSYNAPDRLAGKRVSCKECGESILVVAVTPVSKTPDAKEAPVAIKPPVAAKAAAVKKASAKQGANQVPSNAGGFDGLDALSAAVSADRNSPGLPAPTNPLVPAGVLPAIGSRPPEPRRAKRKRRAWRFPTLRQIGGVLALLLAFAIGAGLVMTLLGEKRAETTVFSYVRGFVTAFVSGACGITWLRGQTFRE